MLEKPLLPPIGRTKVRPMQKRLIRWHATNRNKFIGQKRVTMDRHALMRRLRAHRVNRVRSWSQLAKPPQRSLRLPDTSIGLSASLAFNRNGKHHLPHARRPVIWVFCQQFLQKSETPSRHPGYENGLLNNRVFQQFRPSPPYLRKPQPCLEQLPQMNPHKKPAERGKVGLKL